MTGIPALAGTLIPDVTPDTTSNGMPAARTAAGRWSAVVVLKGSRTLVAAPDGRWAVCNQPNPALAKAGAGDVLTGVIGALLGQGLTPFDAACLAVAVHAMAGELLRDRHGLRGGLASELQLLLPEAWRRLEVADAALAG